jgi:excisionase family DNA binding protein
MTTLPDAPAALTVEEAARVLRIGRSAAYAAVRAGELPVIRLGRRLLVPRARLDRLLGLENGDGPAGDRAVEADPERQLGDRAHGG